MTEHHPDDALVRALLAQDALSAERYGEYRRQLDQRLEAAQRSRSRRLRAWWVAGVVAAASVLVLVFWGPWRSSPAPEVGPSPEDKRVVLRLPVDSLREWGPFELELTANLIATATLGEPFRHDGETLATLHLGRVLKAAADTGEKLPTFCCSCSGPGRPLPPDTFPAGARVLVYLQGSAKEEWGLLEIRPLDDRFEARELPGIERCLAVAAACDSRDPRSEYRRLLAPEAGGLDLAACSALGCRPDPRSADVLLEQLERLRQRIVREGVPPLDGRAGEEVATTFARLTDLLARLHEPRAARPVVECARRFPHGRRSPAYRRLPELCASANEATRTAVRTALVKEMEDPEIRIEDEGPAALALAAVADRQAAEVLVRRQGRRPVTDTNLVAARALAQLHTSLGPPGRDFAREAWLALLRSYRPSPMPTPEPPPAEHRLIREVVGLLRKQELTVDQKKEVREVFNRSGSEWFRRELEPLLK